MNPQLSQFNFFSDSPFAFSLDRALSKTDLVNTFRFKTHLHSGVQFSPKCLLCKSHIDFMTVCLLMLENSISYTGCIFSQNNALFDEWTQLSLSAFCDETFVDVSVTRALSDFFFRCPSIAFGTLPSQ